MTPEDKKRRARRAQEILSDDLMQEAFGVLEREYDAAWRESREDDTEARERAFIYLRILGKVKEHLHSVIISEDLSRKQKKDIVHSRDGLFGSKYR